MLAAMSGYLRDLRAEYGAEYTITVIRGTLWAWRHDGTTPTIRGGTVKGLRQAITADRRARPKIPHPQGALREPQAGAPGRARRGGETSNDDSSGM